MHVVKRRVVRTLNSAFSTLVRHIGSDVSKDNPGFLNLTVGHFEVNVSLGGDYIYVCDYAVGKGYLYRYDCDSVTLITTGKDYAVDQLPTRVLRQLQKGITIALAVLPKFDTPELMELRRQYWQVSFDKMASNSVWGGMGTYSSMSALYQPGLTESITAEARITMEKLMEQVTSADALDSVADLPPKEYTPEDDATEFIQQQLDKRIANKRAILSNRTTVSDAQRNLYSQWIIDTSVQVTYTEHYSKESAKLADKWVAELVG